MSVGLNEISLIIQNGRYYIIYNNGFIGLSCVRGDNIMLYETQTFTPVFHFSGTNDLKTGFQSLENINILCFSHFSMAFFDILSLCVLS